MKRNLNEIAWREVMWQRPFEQEAVLELLIHLASVTPRGQIIWEVRSSGAYVRYYVGSDRQFLKKIQEVFLAHGNIQFGGVTKTARLPVETAKQLKITRPILSLKTDLTEAVVRAGLAALLQARDKEQTVLQIILGLSYAPSPMPSNLPDPHASWLKVAFGNVEQASAESRSSIKEKIGNYSFAAVARLGATGSTATTRIYSLLSALRTLQSAGVAINAATEDTKKLDSAFVPWHFPLRLSVNEVSNLMLLPVGDIALPGVGGLHPKQLLPPDWYRNPDKGHDRTFAVSLDGNTKLSISPQDSLEHTIILGPTGSGKSTAMQSLILADINAGRSVLVIDPKADLVNDILARIPESRDNDVVIIDPSDPCPVGFNPLALKNHHNPGLVADAILAAFQEVFKENWGIRSQEGLSAALLTLVQSDGASLLWLPTLLTDKGFRKKVTEGINDKIGLEPYWTEFESMRDSKRRQEIAPVLNKIRQFLLRPGLRNILGQSHPKFSLTDLFNKPRIVLVPLNKGLIGSESARLLGSLIVGLTWTLALSRARESAERRRLVSVYIDELQDYLNLPTDLSDALAQARGLGVGLTLAHQYRDQLPKEIRAGVDANARSKIVFGLNVGDASDMAKMAPGLEAVDFMTLPRYQIFASFQQGGKNTGWISGRTLPAPRSSRDPIELRAVSMARYGRAVEEVEKEYLDLLTRYRITDTDNAPETVHSPIGRRKKT
jgi:hypothetical protein